MLQNGVYFSATSEFASICRFGNCVARHIYAAAKPQYIGYSVERIVGIECELTGHISFRVKLKKFLNITIIIDSFDDIPISEARRIG